MRRLQQSENVLRQELTVIERNYIPIRVLSNQSNQKNLICPKNNSSLGWIPHLDAYQLIQIRHLSYQTLRQVTPYLISPKCGSAFGQWVIESLKLQTEISKESIIRIVTSLESHVDLRLKSSRQLPGFLITTTLNLPPGETEITLQANAALGTTPPPKLFPPPQIKLPIRPSSSLNSSSSGRPSSAGKPPTFQQRSF